MSSIAFNSALLSVSPVSVTGQQVQRSNTSTTAAAAGSDSVSLSPTAQATALQQQGYTVNEIASTLGLTTATVDSYLHIITATSSAGGGVPAAGAGHAGAAHAAAAGSTAASASGTTASSKRAPAAAESSTAKATPKQQ